MAYITLDELKEILPDILDQWIDEDDESWEWIFSEIEQKCYIGTKQKGKKWKKKLQSMVNTHSTVLSAHRNDINELTKKVDELRRYSTDNLSSRINELSNKVSNLSSSNVSMNTRINRMEQDIKAAKSMAQTAKQRTEVDYRKYSGKSDGDVKYNKEKSDADVVQEVYNRMSGRGATFEELDAFRKVIQKYDALEKKEIPVIKKMCETCKHYVGDPDHLLLSKFDTPPCNSCNGNDKWEAKDNG